MTSQGTTLESCPKSFKLNKLVAAMMVASLASSQIQANPTGASVVNGSVSFDTSVPGVMNITNSPNAIINWQGFSIQQNEITRFIQQSRHSAVLNRVISQNPSQILGQLISNGKVFLINPNGIVFGPNARVNVHSLVASTLNLSNNAFLSGNYHFIAGDRADDIENQGIIHTGKDGNLVLIAPNIDNSGVLKSDGGKITLAAGEKLTLTSLENPEISFEVQASDNEILNVGEMLSQGGAIDLFAGNITHSGIVNADAVQLDAKGNIRLVAQDMLILNQESQTTADNSAGEGGKIQLLGDRVGLFGQSKVSATGETGGGEILIGGDYKGSNPDIKNASATYIGADAEIHADALTDGDGGKVIVWSDEATRMYGTITAKGGAEAGDGGFIETSGGYLDLDENVPDASAPNGEAGTWLIDPDDITIVATGTDANINPTTLTGACVSISACFQTDGAGSAILTTGTILGGGGLGGFSNVIIDTTGPGSGTGNINVNAPIQYTGALERSLSLRAHNDININQNITSTTGILNLNFTANQDAVGGGELNVGALLDTNGGVINSNAAVNSNLLTGSGITNSRIASGNWFVQGNATFNSDVTVDADMTILDGVTLNVASGDLIMGDNAATLTLESTGSLTQIEFSNASTTQLLDAGASTPGSIAFGGTGNNNILNFSGVQAYSLVDISTTTGDGSIIGAFDLSSGTVTATAGRTINLGETGDTWSHASGFTLVADAGTLNFSGTWDNFGSIQVRNSGVLNLDGQFNSSDISALTNDGTGTTNIIGTLDFLGGSITIDNVANQVGNLTLKGGSILSSTTPGSIFNGASGGGDIILTADGGTIDNVNLSGGSINLVSPASSKASLSNTTINSAVSLGAGSEIKVSNSVSFSGGLTQAGSVIDLGTGTLSVTGSLVLDGNTTLKSALHNPEVPASGLIIATGDVSLNGDILFYWDDVSTWIATDGNTFTVITSAGTTGITGTFNNIFSPIGVTASTANYSPTTFQYVTDTVATNIYEWTLGASGNWNVAGNWSGGLVPGSGDYAVIDDTSTLTVSISDVQAIAELRSENNLDLTNGSLTIESNAVINGGLVLSNSQFSGAGALKTTGTTTVNGVASSVVWTNEGIIDWIGSNITINTNSLVNYGTFNAATSGSDSITGTGTFTNALGGVFNRNGTAALITISTPTINNVGTFNLNANTLSIGGTLVSTGTFDIDTGTVLQLDSDGISNFNAGSDILGNGTLSVTAADTMSVNAALAIANTLTLDLDGKLANAANLTIPDAFDATNGEINGAAGNFTTPSTSITTISNTQLTGGVIWDSEGIVNWTGSDFTINTGTFNNKNVFNAATSGSDSITGTGTFTNALGGVFNRNGAGALITISTPTINNVGTFNVNANTLSIGGTLVSTGTFDIDTGTVLQLDSDGISNFNTGSNILGSGTLSVTTADTMSVNATLAMASALTLDLSGTIANAQNLTVPNTFNLNAGASINGTGTFITPAGVTTSLAGGSTVDTLTWQNNGTVNWTAGNLSLDNGATFNNVGTFNAQTSTGQSIQTSVGALGTFQNAGLFNVDTSQTITIDLSFVNPGGATTSLPTAGGTLILSDSGSNTGNINVSSGANLEMSPDVSKGFITFGSLTTTDTPLVFNGAGNVTFNVGSTLSIPGGLSISNGTANINGDLFTGTTGALSVSGGTLTVADSTSPTTHEFTSINMTGGDAFFNNNPVSTASLTFNSTVSELGGSQNITVTGTGSTLDFSNGGTVSGTGTLITSASTTTTLGATNTVTLDRNWINAGTVNWGPGVGDFTITTGNSFTNQAGAFFNNTATSATKSLEGAGTFSNQGTFTQTAAATGTLPVNIAAFDNSGSLIVQGGTLDIAFSDISGTGSVNLSAGNLNLTNNSTTQTLAITGGVLDIGAGATFSVVNLNWGGTSSITGAGTLSTSGAGSVLNAGALTLNTTWNHGGTLSSAANTTVSGTGTFNNSGTLTVNGTGSLSFGAGIAFNNNFYVDVEPGGSLTLLGGGTSPATFNVDGDLYFSGGTHDLTNASVSDDLALTSGRVYFNGADVTLTGATASYSIPTSEVSAGSAVFNISANTNTLSITGGALNIGAGATFSVVDLLWSGGTLGGAGALTTSGTGSVLNAGALTLNTTWNQAGTLTSAATTTLAGTGSLNNSGTFNINTGAALTLSSGFDNAGNLNVQGGSLSTAFTDGSGTGTVTLGGGTLTLTGASATQNLLWSGGSLAGTGALTTSGAGSLLDAGALTLNATWNQAGTLTSAATTTLAGTGSLNNSGTFNINTGAALTLSSGFDNAGNLNVQGGSLSTAFTDGSGTGTVTLGGGTLTLSGASATQNLLWSGGTLAGTGSLTTSGAGSVLNAGALTLNTTWNQAGTLTSAATTTLAGTGSLNNSGTFNINTGAALTLSSGFDNAGNLNVQGGSLSTAFTDASGTGTVTLGGGTLTLTGASATQNLLWSGGTLAGTGALTTSGAGSVLNAGPLTLNTTWNQAGTLTSAATTTLAGTGSLNNSGTFNINTGAALTLSSGFDNIGTLSLQGTLNSTFTNSDNTGIVNLSGGTLNLTGNSDTNLLTLNGGSLTGPGNLTVTGLTDWTSVTTLNAGGTLFADGGLDLALNGTNTINRNIEISAGGTWGGAGFITGTGTITNNVGSNLTITTNSATTSFIIQNTFNNQGSVTRPATGTNAFLVFEGGGAHTGSFNLGRTSNHGFNGGHDFLVGSSLTGSGAAFDGINNMAGTFTLPSGTTWTNNGTFNLSNAGVMQGDGAFAGNLNVINAEIRPGTSVGTLSIDGNLTLDAASTVHIEIEGVTTAGTDYDLLAVTGTAQLLGDINLSHIGATTPTSGQTITPITCAGGCTYNVEPNITSPTGYEYYYDAATTNALVLRIAQEFTFTPAGALVDGAYLWSDPLNWGGLGVPDPGSDVVLDTGGATPININYDGGNLTLNSLQSTENLLVSAGTLGLSADSSVNANVSVTGGTLNTNGIFTVGAGFNMDSGSLTGAGTVDLTGISGGTVTGGTLNGITLKLDEANPLDTFTGTTMQNGIIDVLGFANLDLGESFTMNGGTITADGVNIAGNFNWNGGNINTISGISSSGSITLNGNGTLAGGGLTLNGGLLRGTGTINGSVINSAGIVGPGFSPGTIDISGDYTQMASGVLAIEMLGTTVGDYDRLLVGGTANLDGTMTLTPLSPYDLTILPGDSYDVITATGGIVGDFATITPAVGYTFSTSILGNVYQVVSNSTATTVQIIIVLQDNSLVTLTDQAVVSEQLVDIVGNDGEVNAPEAEIVVMTEDGIILTTYDNLNICR